MVKVTLGARELVMLLGFPLSGGTQLRAGRAELLLRFEYLVTDLVVLGPGHPLIHAQFFRARDESRLVVGEVLGSFRILGAQPAYEGAPPGKVIVKSGGVTAVTDQVIRRALELGHGTLNGIDLARPNRHVVVGPGASQAPGPRVEFRD